MNTKKTSTTVYIRASREEVFDLLGDTSRHREFVWGYVDQLSGPRMMEPGIESIWRIKLFGNTHRVYSCVTGFERPRWCQERIHIPGLFRVTLDQVIEEAEGGVNLTIRWCYAPVSWSATGDTAQRLINGPATVREAVQGTLECLKSVLEKDLAV